MIIFKKRINGTFDKFIDEEFCGNFIGNDESNPFSVELDEWLSNGNIPDWSEVQSLEDAREEKIAQCKSYLNATDKYYIKASEQGFIDYAQKATRQIARDSIAMLKTCNTLEELNAINTKFN